MSACQAKPCESGDKPPHSKWPDQQSIPLGTGLPGIMSLKRSAYPPLGEIRQMERVMTPPGAVIVPEMMVRIFRTDPDGQFGGLHNALSLSGSRIRDFDKKKATPHQDGFNLSGILLFGHFLTAHRLKILLPARHRWVSRPWLAGPALLAGPFLMLGAVKHQAYRDAMTNCVIKNRQPCDLYA
jgi:hypothetical protein